MAGGPPIYDKEALKVILVELFAELPELLRRFGDRLFRQAGRFDDLVQEVSAAALAGIDEGRFTPKGEVSDSLRGYLFRIAEHKYNDYLRKANRDTQSLEQDILEDAVRDNVTPSRIVAEDQVILALQDCLLKLDAEDRDVVTMKYFKGATGPEMAQQLGISRDQVDRRLHRARTMLRSCLGSSGSIRFE